MKKLLFALLYVLRVSQFVAWWNRKQVNILCYHSVTALDEFPDDIHKQHLPRRRFETHLEHLRKYYNVISLPDYLTARSRGETLPLRSVILTFDDGMRNFLTVVAPLLAERSLRATNFIVTDFVSAEGNAERPAHWTPADDRTYLSWEEVRTLAATEAIDFGSHTCSHPKLANMTRDDARHELQASYEALVGHLQCERLALAFPHDQSSEWLRNLASSIGYTCALTGKLGANEMEANLFSLRRTVIAADDDLTVFAARVAGVTWWADRLRLFFRQFVKGFPKARKQSYPYFLAKEMDQE
jgi:peptidoglycan/xylan/chitin deacetylase (PgdA/CDA1 family)